MSAELWKWLLGIFASSGVVSIAAYLLRDTISKVLFKSIEHRFEKNIEKFKAEIRENEKELDQIRSFLASARRDRDSAIQSKRLDAAETLLRARHSLSQLSLLVEYIKILNIEQILEDAGDPKIHEFINTLLKPFNIDEKLTTLGTIDTTVSRLYLSEKSLKSFDAYQSIIIHAVMMFKFLSLPINSKGKYLKEGRLTKLVIDLVPSSKEGFDKWGERYAYEWSTYFHDEILKALRHEVSGADDMTRDAESIERLALDSRRAQINVRSSLEQVGLPDNLIRSDKTA